MLEVTSNSYYIQTKNLCEGGLRSKYFDVFFLHRKNEIRKGMNDFLDNINAYGIEREVVEKCIAKYLHCIKLDIKCKYDDRINRKLIGVYLKEVLDTLADLGYNCDKRHEVYEYVNQHFKDYYNHNMKTTYLYFGGMTTYMS